MPLCTPPSPAERLYGIAEHASVKHDGAIHPEYGGNKIRKLEFVAPEILRTGTRHVYSIAGSGSNFGVAAAMVFRELGFDLTLFLLEQPTTLHVEHNQILMRHYGAHVVRFESMAAAAAAWSAHPRQWDTESYFLPVGASSPVSTFGYVNAAFELRDQIRRGECPEPAEIVVPVGSCSTLAALPLGCSLAGLKSRVIGVRASRVRLGPIDVCTPAVVAKFMGSAAELIRQQGDQDDVALPEPIPNHGWFGGCCSCSTPATEAVMQSGAAVGLVLDPTNSGKAFGEFLRRVTASQQPVLYWATLNSRAGPLSR